MLKGSSPHTRGARPGRSRPPDHGGIIPAYAGSTSRARRLRRRSRDHPRIRGEHAATRRPKAKLLGSSPHTRGARLRWCLGRRPAGIIPAYAGSTRALWRSRSSREDHPRIRGEHADGVLTRMSIGGSSPHTRGAPPRRHHRCAAEGIIPAYAGST